MRELSIPEKISKVAAGINAALTAANEATGKGDETLLGAVSSLTEGYIGDFPLDIAMGSAYLADMAEPVEINHGLGKIPKCMIIFPKNGDSAVAENGKILFAYVYNNGEYQQTDFEDRELTGDNAKYKYCPEYTVGSCAYKDSNGIVKAATLLVPEASGTTEDGVEFSKYTNRLTAFIPRERGGKYADTEYTWIVMADKA